MRLAMFLALTSLLTFGCQTLTPEQKAKADMARAAFTDAGAVVASTKTQLELFLAEWRLIKGRIDAGESIPAVLAARFARLGELITGAITDYQAAVVRFEAAKKASEEAALAGVSWYNRVDWWTVGKFATGLAVGVASIWFPLTAPAMKAAQAVVLAVSAVNAKDQAAGQLVKDAVLASSRALGVEARVDALVQKFDPPKPG